MSELVLYVTDQDFDKHILQSNVPVLVDFWAEWCGPCRMIGPILEDISKEYVGRLIVAKVNIDDNPRTPQRFGVRSIPTLILFKDGEVCATKVGAQPKSQLMAFIDSYL